MNTLQQLSNDFADAVASVGTSLVRVEGRRRQAATGIIWSADGLIVTAHHVIEREETIRIGLPTGERVNATLVGRDPSTDIAVLRISAEGLTPATWAATESLRIGQLVMAVGRPDDDLQATLGVISAVGGEWQTMAGGRIDAFIQTDVTMYPGFSGGALIGAGAQVVGMNTSALARGVSVTLPAATIQRIAGMLAAYGRVKRGFLGVGAQPVRLPAAVAEALGQTTGLLIASVEAGSPAEHAGMFLGDVVVTLDGKAIRHMDDLMALLGSDRVGKTVVAVVLRGGQMTEVSVTIGERD